MSQDFSRLKRPVQEMPDDIRSLLEKNDLLSEFSKRPPYQQNDYLAWIKRAKRSQTRDKRIAQMTSELKNKNIYMKMKWNNNEYNGNT